MRIIVKIGPAVMKIFWTLISLLGVFLISSGFFNTISGLTNFGKVALANTAAISHISGGIVIFILGLVVVAAGYLGIRGKIIITASEQSNENPP